MFDLPISVTIEDREYPIRNKGDYRMVLDCFNALNDEQLSQENRLVTALIIFYDNVSDLSDLVEMFDNDLTKPLNEMTKFFNCGRVEQNLGHKTNYKVVDWQQDEQLIAGAVNEVAGGEIRSLDYLHWWTFMGYYLSIKEGAFSTITGIRYKIKKHQKLEKYEEEFRRDNPEYFIWNSLSIDEMEGNDLLQEIWNRS